MPSKNKNNKRPSWKCLCDCGNPEPVIVYRGCHLKSGNTKSCGCLRSETSSKNLKQIATNQRQYEPIISSARVTFFQTYNDGNLTFEQFYTLSQQNCFYCSKPPSNKRKTIFSYSSEYHKNNCEFIYNGIDRINNNLPHIYENCIPSCKECNLSKRNMSLEDFYNMIVKIHNKETKIPNYEQLYTNIVKDLSQFKRIRGQLHAIYKDINFDQTIFYFIMTLECFYCGNPGSNKLKCKNGDIIICNGLDRIDQLKPHTLNNVIPCCELPTT